MMGSQPHNFDVDFFLFGLVVTKKKVYLRLLEATSVVFDFVVDNLVVNDVVVVLVVIADHITLSSGQ